MPQAQPGGVEFLQGRLVIPALLFEPLQQRFYRRGGCSVVGVLLLHNGVDIPAQPTPNHFLRYRYNLRQDAVGQLGPANGQVRIHVARGVESSQGCRLRRR